MRNEGIITNMRVLKPSRKRLRPGDLFAFQLPDGLYRYGRVISTEASIGPPTKLILVYIYCGASKVKEAIPNGLTPQNLLVPAIITNRLAWSYGYFELLRHDELGPDDVLSVHCFERKPLSEGPPSKYYDEFARRLPGPVEPVGQEGLASYRAIDDEVSKALGIPLAPPSPGDRS